MDGDTGACLYGKNIHNRSLIASTTKIMTAVVVLESMNVDEMISIPKEAVGVEGSSLYLKEGEQITVLDLLYGLMLMSGNDAAEALAGILTGNREDFIALMNRKAAELSLFDTAFANPHGLQAEGHYSTALDLARLMAAAMENEVFREISQTVSCKKVGRQMNNHNKLLGLYDGCVGGKTGYTRNAGRCLVTAAERQGRRLIAVTMQAPDDWNDHATLYDGVFSGMEQAELCQLGTVDEIPIAGGGSCRLYAEAGFSMSLLSGEADKVSVTIHGARMAYGPIMAGDLYGHLNVRLGEQVVFTTPLYYEKEIPAVEKTSVWRSIRQWWRGL